MQTSPPRKLTAILHVGDQKAGSKSIQRFLQINQAALARRGVIRNTGLLHNVYHSGLSAAVASVGAAARPEFGEWGVASAEDQRALRQDLSARLAAEAAAAPVSARAMAFSFEGLLFMTPEEAARLRDFLAPFFGQFLIVAYLRRQDLSAVSRYSTQIVNGRNLDPRLPSLNPFALQPPLRRYDKALETWAALFGGGAVRPRLFQRPDFPNGDLIDDFIEAAALGPADGFERSPPENESHSATTLAVLNALNPQLPPVVGGRRNPARDALIRALAAHAGPDRATPSRAAAWAHYMLHFRSNRRLKRRWFADRRRLFDPGFARYPWIAPRRPTLRDAGPLLAAAVAALSGAAQQRLLEARLARAAKALSGGDAAAARRIARQAAASAPLSEKPLLLLARAELACGDPAAARRAAEAALALTPAHPGAHAVWRHSAGSREKPADRRSDRRQLPQSRHHPAPEGDARFRDEGGPAR